ncbi:MAG: NYN domain-containing protein [Clostridia bacterium]
MKNENYTIALLIDTDNVSSKYINALMKELFVLGKVTYRRMYGDFTQNASEGWKNVVNKYAITPVQQYTYTVGKNATDSRMVIDAMDILYSGSVDAFCIMSSDSDFTGIAKRLKESNKFVIGAGERKTPNSFVNCCDRFFILEEISGKTLKKLNNNNKPNTQIKKKPNNPIITNNVVNKEKEIKEEIKVNKEEIKEVREIKVNKEEIKEEVKEVKEEIKDIKEIKDNKEKDISISIEEDENVISKEEIEDFAMKILEDYNKPIELALLIQKIYQAYPQFNFKNFGYKKAIDFFDEEKFVFTKGKTTEKFITLK